MINDGNVRRSMIDSITLTFNQAVTLNSGAVTLVQRSGSVDALDTSLGLSSLGTVGLSITNPSNDHKTFVITFTSSTLINNSLEDGVYDLTVNHADVVEYGTSTTAYSSDQDFTFHRLYGDFLGTGTVNGGDLAVFINAFNQPVSSAGWYLDFYGSGNIDLSTLSAIDLNFGSSYGVADAGVIEGTTSLTDYYYSTAGQIIQEDSISGGTATLSLQNVWGEAYVNELILRDDSDGPSSGMSYGVSGSGLDERLYALYDADYNVTSILNVNGAVMERFLYDPWGNRQVTDYNYNNPESGPDAFGWTVGYQGMELDTTTGLIFMKVRYYNPVTHMTMQPDPLMYINGLNYYPFEKNNPGNSLDPTGTSVEEEYGLTARQVVFSYIDSAGYTVTTYQLGYDTPTGFDPTTHDQQIVPVELADGTMGTQTIDYYDQWQVNVRMILMEIPGNTAIRMYPVNKSSTVRNLPARSTRTTRLTRRLGPPGKWSKIYSRRYTPNKRNTLTLLASSFCMQPAVPYWDWP